MITFLIMIGMLILMILFHLFLEIQFNFDYKCDCNRSKCYCCKLECKYCSKPRKNSETKYKDYHELLANKNFTVADTSNYRENDCNPSSDSSVCH